MLTFFFLFSFFFFDRTVRSRSLLDGHGLVCDVEGAVYHTSARLSLYLVGLRNPMLAPVIFEASNLFQLR